MVHLAIELAVDGFSRWCKDGSDVVIPIGWDIWVTKPFYTVKVFMLDIKFFYCNCGLESVAIFGKF